MSRWNKVIRYLCPRAINLVGIYSKLYLVEQSMGPRNINSEEVLLYQAKLVKVLIGTILNNFFYP